MSQGFAPADVCAIFGFSKSTLFRYERDGVFPPVPRASHADERTYLAEHLDAIATRRLHDLFQSAHRAEDEKKLQRTMELRGALRLLVDGSDDSFDWIEQLPTLGEETLRFLLRFVLPMWQVGDRRFNHTLRLILCHSEQLPSPADSPGRHV